MHQGSPYWPFCNELEGLLIHLKLSLSIFAPSVPFSLSNRPNPLSIFKGLPVSQSIAGIGKQNLDLP
jgi:hypothetical protein